ncbi:enoyl-CoA hydratase [Aquihabitans sp. McL0605]|uniref:enoyl-CoA hydratase n=1 Tax=Aquihabitans sp. McL0605 TaxID=3415671 RepID=UPI003CF69D9B
MTSGDGAVVLRSDRGPVATLTLARPEARNALSLGVLDALLAELSGVDADRSIHVVVLAGEGPAFSAGHDLREIVDQPDDAYRHDLFTRCSEVMIALTRLRQPVIAKVAGVATAAGCQLVASCDLAVAAASARFATPGVNIGLFCTTPMVALTRNVAPKAAMEMLLTGALIPADEALRIGLLNRVVPDGSLDAEVDALADLIASKPPETVALGKAAFWRLRDLPLVDAYADASRVMAANLGMDEAAEGISAFLEKRPPRWGHG